MAKRTLPIVALSEMENGQEADLFALLSDKQEMTTRDGKPYHRVTFRDDRREVSFPIWNDTPWTADCRDHWTVGCFYKLRATFRETQYGPQLEIRKIREVNEEDAADGFDPSMCCAASAFDPDEMFDALIELVQTHVSDEKLQELAVSLLADHRDTFVRTAAARRHHHAYHGGLLEHTLSVTRNALFFAHKYAEDYADLDPPLSIDMVVAGAALHDIGKVVELEQQPTGAEYTTEGELLGHLLLGRDLVRERGQEIELDEELRLRMEHLIIAHQRLPEWGSPKPPMTPEALLVHYADDVDAKFNMMTGVLKDDTGEGPFTSSRNIMRQKVYRGNGG